MIHDYSMSSNGLMLKPLAHDDIETLRVLRNGSASFFLDKSFIDREQQEAWYKRYLEKHTDVMFACFLENSITPVAFSSLYDIDVVDGVAEFGRLIVDPTVRGKGLGHNVTFMTLEVGFRMIGLQEIVLEVWGDNAPAKAVYQGIGFKERGIIDRSGRESVKMFIRENMIREGE